MESQGLLRNSNPNFWNQGVYKVEQIAFIGHPGEEYSVKISSVHLPESPAMLTVKLRGC